MYNIDVFLKLTSQWVKIKCRPKTHLLIKKKKGPGN